MSKTPTERIIQWLRDAHTMETEAETMLKAMSSRIEHYPDLKQRIDRHIEETRGQAQRIEARLKALDSSPSAAKDMMANVMAAMHAGGNAMMSDEVVKGLGISYAFEHMEIASYRNLMFAAEAAAPPPAPGAAAEYGLRSGLNPNASGWPIALYPLAGISGTVVGPVKSSIDSNGSRSVDGTAASLRSSSTICARAARSPVVRRSLWSASFSSWLAKSSMKRALFWAW